MFSGASSFGSGGKACLDRHRLKLQLTHQVITVSSREGMCIPFCASRFVKQ